MQSYQRGVNKSYSKEILISLSCTCYVDMILVLKDSLANRKPDFDMSCGHPWKVYVQITHKVWKLPVLQTKVNQSVAAVTHSEADASNEKDN